MEPANPADHDSASEQWAQRVVGTKVTYTLTVTNHGPRPATAKVTDTLPATMTFVSASGQCRKPPVGSTGTITCTTRRLAPGSVAIITVVG